MMEVSLAKDKSKKKNTSLRLDDKTLKRLKMLAVEEDSSVQRIVEKLVHEYLEKREKGKK